jgi:hypothetical protein
MGTLQSDQIMRMELSNGISAFIKALIMRMELSNGISAFIKGSRKFLGPFDLPSLVLCELFISSGNTQCYSLFSFFIPSVTLGHKKAHDLLGDSQLSIPNANAFILDSAS